MRKMILLLNHELTKYQLDNARQGWNISDFIYPPGEIKELWMKVNPYDENVSEQLGPFQSWIKSVSVKGDYVLIQGEYGATFYIVDYCFQINRIPIYATSERRYEERILLDGSIERKHVFKHVRFRKYVKWSGEVHE